MQDSSASYNYIESTSDPSPYSFYDSHGTNCAGIVGMARDNTYCGVGVAYNCKLGGIMMLLHSKTMSFIHHCKMIVNFLHDACIVHLKMNL